MSTLHPFEGPRGLKGYTQFVATYEEHVELVELQQSSAVAVVSSMGSISEIVTTGSPGYCWLRIERPPGPRGEPMSGSAHLSRDNARELRDALDAFLNDGEDEPDDNENDHR